MAMPAFADDQKRAIAARLLSGAHAPAGAASWAEAVRAAARERLMAMGAPVRRDEYWRYTDPALLVAGEPPALHPDAPDPFDRVDCIALAIADGAAPVPAALPQGLEALRLADALAADLSPARGLFGALEAAGQEKVARPLAALNTALAVEGLVLRATGAVAAPVHLRMTGAPGFLRHLVRVETGASLTLFESGAAQNAVIEVDLAPGAAFHHVRVQEGRRARAATHLFARVAAGAVFKTFTLAADGALTRNEVVFDLVGDDAVGHCAGGLLGTGTAHLDTTVFVTHTGLRGESRQVFKTVLDGQARSVFQGKIFVRPGAQKTDGYQLSQAVLLSGGAEFDAKPELEIYADDVKCSHGSTTGAMDEEALFYLRARGVPLREAEAMLVSAFVEEAIAEVAHEGAAEALRGRVAAWMASR
jgi:Fe-S cluster assembly protein SufD